MNDFKNKITSYWWIIPSIVILLLALIATLRSPWPLGWDIIYHIQYAQVYSQYGFTLTDPLLNAPLGQKIGYPPIFHFLLAGIGNLFQTDYFQVARILQPLLAFLVVLSTSYVATKFYGKLAGATTGFLIIGSYLISRLILPIPENLALIFIPLAVYAYYLSIKNENLKLGVISGFLLILTMGIHIAAPLCLFLTITTITLVELILRRDQHILKYYGAFLSPPIILGVLGLISIIILYPDFIQGILNQGLTAITGVATSLQQNRPLGILGYLKNLGPILLLFGLIGTYYALNKRGIKEIVLISWLISMVLLSLSYLVGINVISYRLLVYILLPLAILGGYGVKKIYQTLNERGTSKQILNGIVAALFIICIFNGFLTVTDPKISQFNVKTDLGSLPIAPPSAAEEDLVRWFQENGNQNLSFVTSNQFTGMFLVTKASMPMHYGFEYFSTNPNVTINMPNVKASTREIFQEQKVGYIIYDKRLVLNPPRNELFLEMIPAEFYPLYYFSQDIPSNINQIKPTFSRVVYENSDYLVVEVQ